MVPPIPAQMNFAGIETYRGTASCCTLHFLLDYQIIAFGAYDPALHLFLENFVTPGMVCFDVGANIWAVSLHLASLTGPNGKVFFCFEPVPYLFRRLQMNTEHSRHPAILDIRQLALSDANGKSVFHMAKASCRNQGMGSLVNDDDPSIVELRRGYDHDSQ